MIDIGFSAANTFSLATHYYASRATCPTHGEVGGDFRVYVTGEPVYASPKLCPKCFVDFIAAHVTHVQPLTPVSGERPNG